MKKFLTSILAIFCLAGTGFAKTYNIKANNDDVVLKKSDIIVVELSENPSTGFEWEFSSTDENVAKVIDKRLVFPPRHFWEPPKCGEPGTAVYKIRAINSGNAQIKGVYRRPWESRAANREYTLNITVK